MIRSGVAVCVLALAGCFSPQFADGQVTCGPGGSCPPGFTCSSTNVCTRNPGTPDDAAHDAPLGDGGIDAPGDAPLPPPATGQELVTGAGRLTGATFQLDVQIGNFHAQSRATSTTFTLEGNATVKP